MIAIPVIVGTARRSRRSLPVARSIAGELRRREGVVAELLDIGELGVPIFAERFEGDRYPSPGVRTLCEAAAAASGICIVAPEYKNGIPGSLKNTLGHVVECRAGARRVWRQGSRRLSRGPRRVVPSVRRSAPIPPADKQQ